MKYLICFAAILLFGCDPIIRAPATPQMVWIDVNTKNDTIITNVNSRPSVLYYAVKNWQQSDTMNFSQGYRLIAIRFGDSVLVKPLTDSSTNYKGPFLLKLNDKNDTLIAQKFIDSTNADSARVFILLK